MDDLDSFDSEAAREMFMTEGWENFQAEVRENIADCTLDKARTIEELWFQKGRLAVLRTIAGYETFIKKEEDERELGSFLIN